MSRPAVNEYLDPIHSRMSLGLIQKADNFIAAKAFPFLKVDDKTGNIYLRPTAIQNRDDAKVRLGAQESVGGGPGLSSVSYNCEQYSYHVDTDRQQKSRSKGPLDWRRAATRFVTNKMLIRLERLFAAEMMASSKWGTDKTVTTKWDDHGGSDPIGDVDLGKSTVLTATGFKPNVLACGYNVARHLMQHPDIVDRYQATGLGALEMSHVAEVLGLEEIIVSSAVYNTADEGQTESNAFCVGNHALLFYRDNTDEGEDIPTAGRICHWPLFEGVEQGVAISEIPADLKNGSTRTEGDFCVDPKIFHSSLGYFFPSVVSA